MEEASAFCILIVTTFWIIVLLRPPLKFFSSWYRAILEKQPTVGCGATDIKPNNIQVMTNCETTYKYVIIWQQE